ncbi:RBBP9/YdeN family alpha/beta hydrolase [Actinoplanes aureus]|uniref:Serine hydrolase family protein n=1 Tax=Actinoplanes aureus TaxID=2792083 RepID=A0A931CDE5_9ACTN|nr:alpha/beta fold hydrolase [Actinoplanes aureus]MBG0565922.1 serine hydrolase family protein [Actinoplanes aureus]
MTERIRVLLVPGRGKPFPEHWSVRWEAENPEFHWAPEPPGPPYLPDERVADLDAALRASDEPAVLVAHSAGCLTVAFWAQEHSGPVRAALMVTPPFLERPDVTWTPLPFRTVVAASRDDPHSTFEQAADTARQWGAEVFDAGAVGHLDSKTGFGPWPAGERLVKALIAGAPVTG